MATKKQSRRNNHKWVWSSTFTNLEKQFEKTFRGIKKQWTTKDYQQAKSLANGIVKTLKDIMQDNQWIVRTRDIAASTSHELLSKFDLPTQKDVKSLNARLSRLEKRLSQLSR